MSVDIQDFRRKAEKRVVELERIVDAPLSKTLVCPNAGCRKMFRRVLILTDLSRRPRQSYYACPHCLSKVEVFVDPECPYYLNFLKFLPKNTSIPDQCLTCPKILHCKLGILSSNLNDLNPDP